MGLRPSLPDSLPVIGHSKATADIVYAFGHGHLGLTQAAATGSLVADLVARRRPAIDLNRLSTQSFLTDAEASWRAIASSVSTATPAEIPSGS